MKLHRQLLEQAPVGFHWSMNGHFYVVKRGKKYVFGYWCCDDEYCSGSWEEQYDSTEELYEDHTMYLDSEDWHPHVSMKEMKWEPFKHHRVHGLLNNEMIAHVAASIDNAYLASYQEEMKQEFDRMLAVELGSLIVGKDKGERIVKEDRTFDRTEHQIRAVVLSKDQFLVLLENAYAMGIKDVTRPLFTPMEKP